MGSIAAHGASETRDLWCRACGRGPLPRRRRPGVFLMESGNGFENLKRKSNKKGNWFQKYQLLFGEDLKIELKRSPVDVDTLEQIILTRNDFEHNSDLFSTSVYQSDDHAKKYPESLFIDDDYLFESRYAQVPLKVNREKLDTAINAVMGFCEFLDGIRADYHEYLRSL